MLLKTSVMRCVLDWSARYGWPSWEREYRAGGGRLPRVPTGEISGHRAVRQTTREGLEGVTQRCVDLRYPQTQGDDLSRRRKTLSRRSLPLGSQAC